MVNTASNKLSNETHLAPFRPTELASDGVELCLRQSPQVSTVQRIQGRYVVHTIIVNWQGPTALSSICTGRTIVLPRASSLDCSADAIIPKCGVVSAEFPLPGYAPPEIRYPAITWPSSFGV